MLIIGCDYHPSFQQIAFVDTDTGELQERRLEHREEAEKFYSGLGVQGMKVRVGMEASGHARWFERRLAELNFELGTFNRAQSAYRRRLVDSRTTSSGEILRWTTSTFRFSSTALMPSRAMFTAKVPMPSMGWRTVVSEGVHKLDIATSSKPITEQ